MKEAVRTVARTAAETAAEAAMRGEGTATEATTAEAAVTVANGRRRRLHQVSASEDRRAARS
jgi:hypothetical protein